MSSPGTVQRALLGHLGRGLAYFVLLELGLAAAILYWPNFEENVGNLRAMAPLPVLKDLVDELGQGGIAAYVLGQHFFKGCNTLGVAAAVLFACGAVAGEAHRGTLEVWLARPLPRWRILAERWAAGALGVVVPVYLSSLTAPLFLARVGEEMDVGTLVDASHHQSLFLLAIYAFTFFVSVIGRNPTRIAFLVLGLCVLEFSLYLVKTATNYSLFRLADVQAFMRIHTSGGLDASKVWPLVGITALLTAASFLAFRYRRP